MLAETKFHYPPS